MQIVETMFAKLDTTHKACVLRPIQVGKNFSNSTYKMCSQFLEYKEVLCPLNDEMQHKDAVKERAD